MKKAKTKKRPNAQNVVQKIVDCLKDSDGLQAKWIADAIGASYQSVSSHLKEMEKAGYTLSYPDPQAEVGLVNKNTKLWILTCDGEEHYLYSHATIAE